MLSHLRMQFAANKYSIRMDEWNNNEKIALWFIPIQWRLKEEYTVNGEFMSGLQIVCCPKTESAANTRWN